MSLTIDVNAVWKPLNNCLISLPSSFIYPILDSTNLLVQQIIVKIINPENEKLIVIVGWNGTTSLDPHSIEIDTQYAKLLKISDKSLIKIELDLQLINDIKNKINSTSVSVEIEPETTADWELTEIYAQAIELNFLSQVRCVSKNQSLLVRANPTASGVSNSGLIKFRVKNIKTQNKETEFSIIGNNTELYIIPKPHINNNNNDSQNLNNEKSSNGNKKKYSSSSRKSHFGSDFIIKRSIIKSNGIDITVYNNGPKLNQFKNVEYVQVSVIEGPGTLLRARKTSSKEIEMGLSRSMFGRKIVARYVEDGEDDEDEDEDEDEMIASNSNEDKFSKNIKKNSLMISPLLAISLGLENTIGEIISIEPCNRKCIKLNIEHCTLIIHKLITENDNSSVVKKGEKIEFRQEERNEKKLKQLDWKRKMSDMLKQILKQMYGKNTPLTDGMKLPIIENVLSEGAILEITNETLKSMSKKKQQINAWILFNSKNDSQEISSDNEEISLQFNLGMGKDILVPESRIQKPFYKNYVPEIFGQDKKIETIKELLLDGVSTFLFGKSGSGKTLVSNIMKKMFIRYGYYVKLINFDQIGTSDINDKDIFNIDDNDNTIDSETSENSKKNNNKNKLISDIFENILRECSWRSPALIILENLDKVLPKDADFGDSGASSQLTDILINKAKFYCLDNDITFLITSKSTDSINKTIFQNHFVDEEIGLEAPNKVQLTDILQKMVGRKFPEYIDSSFNNWISDITSELEGYLPLDIENLVDRAFHHMITEERKKFEFDDFMVAIEDYTPTSLRGVKLQKATTSWSNIGGLIEVKKILLETLEWPTKYAPIFEKCTLRLRSGILLYGYPGCGKTMLASAISSQCGLNFISVKGPEILNKYIGASEQSVRELFERAQSAKPCILFFDEFDSIAPKRGHDSTGVTDRIVNQLLTQMDGAEGLEGVYVLAATSRPDLIDSALLRPGRLDKSVICDLPDFENRLDILKTIVKSNGFNLRDEDCLFEISKLTNGYTGADLQAVVYNAYLKGVHEKLELEAANHGIIEESERNETDTIEYKIILSNKLRRFEKNSALNKKKIETLVDNYKKLSFKNDNENDMISNSKLVETEIEKVKEKIYISFDQLKESLSETKKSISVKELEKLKNIYEQFEGSKRPSEMKDGEGSTDVGVRATLM